MKTNKSVRFHVSAASLFPAIGCQVIATFGLAPLVWWPSARSGRYELIGGTPDDHAEPASGARCSRTKWFSPARPGEIRPSPLLRKFFCAVFAHGCIIGRHNNFTGTDTWPSKNPISTPPSGPRAMNCAAAWMPASTRTTSCSCCSSNTSPTNTAIRGLCPARHHPEGCQLQGHGRAQGQQRHRRQDQHPDHPAADRRQYPPGPQRLPRLQRPEQARRRRRRWWIASATSSPSSRTRHSTSPRTAPRTTTSSATPTSISCGISPRESGKSKGQFYTPVRSQPHHGQGHRHFADKHQGRHHRL